MNSIAPDDEDGNSAEPAPRDLALARLIGAALQTVVTPDPSRSGDPDILDVKGVCAALRCAEDTVRRIPAAELPVYRVGKVNLYFREDLLRYVRSQQVGSRRFAPAPGAAGNEPARVDGLVHEMLGSPRVDAPRPAKRRAG